MGKNCRTTWEGAVQRWEPSPGEVWGVLGSLQSRPQGDSEGGTNLSLPFLDR